MLHTLNLYSAVCQLHVYKTGGKILRNLLVYSWRPLSRGSTSTDSTNQSENVGEKNPESLKEQNLNLSCTDKIYIAFLLYKYYRQSRAKFKLQLKKAGKTTRPFRYDLNQIPCNYSGSDK